MELPIDPDTVRGFLHPEEGARLYELAMQAMQLGPGLEVGSYCGKSTLYLGTAARDSDSVLYALDHHRGSEEHQIGEAYHDADLFDEASHQMDSLPALRQTLHRATLEQWVIPHVASSSLAGRFWTTPLALIFIDGGHSREAALTDYRTWIKHLLPCGILAIHDIFPDPADGGQAPFEIYSLAQASGLFETLEQRQTLGALRRL